MSLQHEDEGDRLYDDHMAAVDAGEACPDCPSHDIKVTESGPQWRIPLFECRLCGCLWFDAVTRPTTDDRTLPLFPA
jgi:hypothetical protein